MWMQVREHHFQVLVVRLEGRIDAANVPYLKSEFMKLTDSGKCSMVLDLGDVTFIDSSGLGFLASLLRAVRACGGEIRFVIEPHSTVHKIISLVKFDSVLEICETIYDALRPFSRNIQGEGL